MDWVNSLGYNDMLKYLLKDLRGVKAGHVCDVPVEPVFGTQNRKLLLQYYEADNE